MAPRDDVGAAIVAQSLRWGKGSRDDFMDAIIWIDADARPNELTLQHLLTCVAEMP
jgi:hypothetical protein